MACKWRLPATVLLCLVLHVKAHAKGSHHVTYMLQSQENTCFSQMWTEGQKVSFEYQVLRGGNKDVNVQIISPNGLILYDKDKSKSDEVTFTPNNGEFKFCFENDFSQLSDKVVTFHIGPVDPETLSQEAGQQVPTVKQADETACDNMHEIFTRIFDLQLDAPSPVYLK